uniref:DOMON domain-containing protein n=1 Tax=Plectus sambesii TaxID=2011161 RepID=A0A914V4V9_9BILA
MALLIAITVVFFFSQEVFAQSNSTCSFKDGTYSLSWRYDPESRMVVFDLSAAAPQASPDFWTGVGFGESMADMDFIGVFVRNGQIGVADTNTNGHAQPVPDEIANVQILSFEFDNGIVSASFARPVVSPDPKDKSLETCQTFQFPVSGGPIQGTGLTKHLETPKSQQVCNIVTECVGTAISGSAVTADGSVTQSSDQNETSTTPVNSFTDSSNVSNPELSANQAGNNSVPADGATTSVLPGAVEPTAGIAEGTNSSAAVGGGDACSFSSGSYAISWTFDPATNNINFQLSTLVEGQKFWTGVGIGQNMENLDIMLALVDDNVVTGMSDMKADRHGEPQNDTQQDIIYNNDGSVIDGRVLLSFSRPLTTADSAGDLPIDGDGCTTFQFPVSGGAFIGQGRIRKHATTPVSKEVCSIKSLCLAGQVPPGSSAVEPTLSPPGASNTSNALNTPSDAVNSTDSNNSNVGGADGSSTSSGVSTSQSAATPTPSGESTSTPFGDVGSTTTTLGGVGAEGTNNSLSIEPGLGSTPSTSGGTPALVCNPDQTDLLVCKAYFDEYFARVDDWARQHSVTPESQYSKACKLIGEVANVKSLCCNSFVDKCRQHTS